MSLNVPWRIRLAQDRMSSMRVGDAVALARNRKARSGREGSDDRAQTRVGHRRTRPKTAVLRLRRGFDGRAPPQGLSESSSKRAVAQHSECS